MIKESENQHSDPISSENSQNISAAPFEALTEKSLQVSADQTAPVLSTAEIAPAEPSADGSVTPEDVEKRLANNMTTKLARNSALEKKTGESLALCNMTPQERIEQKEAQEDDADDEDEYLPRVPPLPLGKMFTPQEQEMLDEAAYVSDSTIQTSIANYYSILACGVEAQFMNKVKQEWYEPGCLWILNFAGSGDGKSRCSKLFFAPFRKIQKQSGKDYMRAKYAFDKAQEAKGKDVDPFADAPLKKQFYIKDTTIEGIIKVLVDNDEGIMLIKDEAQAFKSDFGRYQASVASSIAQLMSFYDGDDVVVTRADPNRNTESEDLIFISIKGNLPTKKIPKIFTWDDIESGLMPRFISVFSEARLDDSDGWESKQFKSKLILEKLAQVLWQYKVNGKTRIIIEPEDEAREYNHIKYREFKQKGNITENPFYRRLIGIAQRLALNLHISECILNDKNPVATKISLATMERAWANTEWIRENQKLLVKLIPQEKPSGIRIPSLIERLIIQAVCENEEEIRSFNMSIGSGRLAEIVRALPGGTNISADSIGKRLKKLGLLKNDTAEIRGWEIPEPVMLAFKKTMKPKKDFRWD